MNPHRLRRALALSAAERRLAVEALTLMAISRTVLALLPFRIAMRRFGLRLDHGIEMAADEEEKVAASPAVLLVGDAVRRAASVSPFRAVCLQQAIAAALMLRRRGHAVQVHFGVARDQDGNLIAHAWCRCQGKLVTGGHEAVRYQPISVFVT